MLSTTNHRIELMRKFSIERRAAILYAELKRLASLPPNKVNWTLARADPIIGEMLDAVINVDGWLKPKPIKIVKGRS